MARVPLIDENDPDADPQARAVLDRLKAKYGEAPWNVERALANHPVLLEKLWDLADSCYFGGNLNDRQREIPYLTSAMTMECFY